MRQAVTGDVRKTTAVLHSLWTRRCGDAISYRIHSAVDQTVPCSLADSIYAQMWTPPPAGAPYSKELRLLASVLATASAGDPHSVCGAIERFGAETARKESLWLKVAGGLKTAVLLAALELAPSSGVILEIGTYCGYSAMRLAAARPNVRVVTLEVDAVHAIIARNLIAFAGLAHVIDVLVGHSEDTLPVLGTYLQGRSPEGAGILHRNVGNSVVAYVFMDQRGSRYFEDLSVLEDAGLLGCGAVVVADNVLKPGAPAYLWHVTRPQSADKQPFWEKTSNHSAPNSKRNTPYRTSIVQVPEFAMPGVEDWISVSICDSTCEGTVASSMRKASGPLKMQREELPLTIQKLEREADIMRDLASDPMAKRGSACFDEWAAFVDRMRHRLQQIGIWEDAEWDASSGMLRPTSMGGAKGLEGQQKFRAVWGLKR